MSSRGRRGGKRGGRKTNPSINKQAAKNKQLEEAKKREAEASARRTDKVREDEEKRKEAAQRLEEEQDRIRREAEEKQARTLLQAEEQKKRKEIEDTKRRAEDLQKQRDKIAEDSKKAQDEIRRRIEAEALQRRHHEEAKKGIIEERARLEREAIENQQKESQQEMLMIHEQMRRQKEDAFRQMEQEKRDRERRELLRREHEASLNRPRPKPVVQPVVKPPPVKLVRRRSDEGLAFQPENELEENLLSEYQIHQSQSELDPKLPRVTLSKRNGKYWLGQRRIDAIFLDESIYIKEGASLNPFLIWIKNAERIEAIRMKGLQSAQPLLLQTSAFMPS
jgi:myosin heavy subunit